MPLCHASTALVIIIIKRQLISHRNMPGDIETDNKKHLSSLLKVLMDSALRINVR